MCSVLVYVLKSCVLFSPSKVALYIHFTANYQVICLILVVNVMLSPFAFTKCWVWLRYFTVEFPFTLSPLSSSPLVSFRSLLSIAHHFLTPPSSSSSFYSPSPSSSLPPPLVPLSSHSCFFVNSGVMDA